MTNSVKIVFGAMTFGKPSKCPVVVTFSIDTLGARIHEVGDASAILDTFQKHGHKEIDTARAYGGGTSEEMLSQLDMERLCFSVATKVYPSVSSPLKVHISHQYSHSPEVLRRGLTDALKALNAASVDLFYLHAPDRTTPFVETLREINNMHKKGLFKRFGISNFMSWEVSTVCEICRSNGWVQPSVYQGIYHALQRSIEPELLPCLRHYGLSLYAFQPLAEGFLTGRYSKDQENFEAGSRFDPNIWQGRLHRDRYWSDTYFTALEHIHKAAESNGLTDAEVALRWLKHHSKIAAQHGDAIIVGASSVNHLENNLCDLEKGPLPEAVVEAMEKAWLSVKGLAPKYWH